jgi:hypothetical protein
MTKSGATSPLSSTSKTLKSAAPVSATMKVPVGPAASTPLGAMRPVVGPVITRSPIPSPPFIGLIARLSRKMTPPTMPGAS